MRSELAEAPHKLCSYPEEIESRVYQRPRDCSLKVSSCHQTTAAVVTTLVLILSSARLVGNRELNTPVASRKVNHHPLSFSASLVVREQGRSMAIFLERTSEEAAIHFKRDHVVRARPTRLQ